MLLLNDAMIYTLIIIIPLSFYCDEKHSQRYGGGKVWTDKIRGIARGLKRMVICAKHLSGELQSRVRETA